MDIFGADLAPAAIVLVMLLLNLMKGACCIPNARMRLHALSMPELATPAAFCCFEGAYAGIFRELPEKGCSCDSVVCCVCAASMERCVCP